MAAKTIILPPADFTYFAQLHLALRAVDLRKYLTKTQGDAIAHAVDERLQFPVNLALAQRTPKGTVYVYRDDTLAFTIDQRGAFSWPSHADSKKSLTSAK